MKRWLTFVTALFILAASGLVHGIWAERWSPATALQEAAARVDEVPLEFGDWKGQTIEAEPGVFYQAGAQRFWTRSYVNSRKKTTFLVILMCGRSGRMAVHTPEICYRGAGYEMDAKSEAVAVKGPGGEQFGSLWTARFSKGAGVASELRLYWGWNAGGLWQASSNPRWELGDQPFLYKLYVSHDAQGNGSAGEELDFLRQFLPELRKTLVLKSLLQG